MSISTLQREALERSPEFNQQVEGVVRGEALYKNEFMAPDDPDRLSKQQTYAQVVRQPAAYGFVPALVADAGWTLTYDGWASDPDAATGAIQAGVQKSWQLLTGVA